MPLTLSFAGLQALCLGLNHYPASHPNRWECIARLVSDETAKQTVREDALVFTLPGSRKRKAQNTPKQNEDDVKRWARLIEEQGLKLLDKEMYWRPPIKAVGDLPVILEPGVFVCCFRSL